MAFRGPKLMSASQLLRITVLEHSFLFYYWWSESAVKRFHFIKISQPWSCGLFNVWVSGDKFNKPSGRIFFAIDLFWKRLVGYSILVAWYAKVQVEGRFNSKWQTRQLLNNLTSFNRLALEHLDNEKPKCLWDTISC